MENTRIFYKYVKEKNVNGQWCTIDESEGEISEEMYYVFTLADTYELLEHVDAEDIEGLPRFRESVEYSDNMSERTILAFDFIDSEVA